jgi:hypothetical protein
MGKLTDVLNDKQKRIHKCAFRDWKNTLDEEDLQSLIEAFADRSISTTSLTHKLQLAGCPVGRERVNDHRIGRCKSCGEA